MIGLVIWIVCITKSETPYQRSADAIVTWPVTCPVICGCKLGSRE